MVRGALVVVLLTAGAATVIAEPAQHGQFTGEPFAPEPFAFEVFTRQQGAPENAFYSVAADRHGRLALGMINGAGLFNGTSFRRVDDGDGTPHGATVYTIAADAADRLWVGTPRGLYVGGAAGWRTLTPRDGLPNLGVNQVRYVAAAGAARSASGRDAVYVATQGGVAIFDPDRLERRGTIDAHDGLAGDNVYVTLDVAAGPLAGLWVGGPWGLAHRPPGAPRFTMVMAPAAPAEQATRALYFDDERQALWVGTEAGLVRIGGDRTPVVVPEVRDAPIGSIVRIRRRDGTWLCAARLIKGFACLAGTAWREFHLVAEQGTERAVFALTSAGTANGADVLWIATDSGLVRAVEPAVRRIADGPAILQRRIDGIVAASDGALWVASGADLARIAWPRWSVWHAPDDDEIRVLRELPRTASAGGGAAVAAGTGLGKIYVFDGDAPALHPFTLAAGSAVMDLATTREPGGATLWIGVNGALWSWDGRRGEAVKPSDGLRSLWIAKLLATARDRDRDDLWVGLNSTGLARRRAGAWQNLTARDGIDDSDNVTALLADRGALWVGMQAAGARRLSPLPDPSHAERFTETTTPALPDGTINSIAADRAGRIYLCTNRGIARIEQQPGGFAVRTFDRDDGMPDEECSMNAAATDAAGRVFLGTMHGLTFLDPAAIDDQPRPAELVLERASYAAGAALVDGARLDHDENKLVF
ncbi:MAG TPA: hypothetical protein VK601_11980, partial [Kofleriaceae bacterium]|nr:hypothetical protein [Kofleriaceae bacterium]